MMGGMKGAVIGLAGPAAMGLLIKNSLAEADALGKLSDKLQVSTEELYGLQRAAELSGGTAKGMAEAMTKSAKRLGEAATGGGAAAKTIEKLGLDIQELQKLSPDKLFMSYADSIGEMTNRGEQMAAVSALMGDEARSMMGFIDGGSEAMRASIKEAETLGLTMSRVEVKQLENANDTMADFMRVVKSVGNHLAFETCSGDRLCH